METMTRSLDDVMAFHLVASQRSYTRAAELCGTSKSMLSKQVQRLEATVGTQLFSRTTRRLDLTEEGAALFEYSQKIWNLAEEASRQLREMNHGTAGMVRISLPISLGEAFAPTFLRMARARLPNVKFDIDVSSDFRDLRSETDFAVRASDQIPEDAVARHLGRLRDVICASPELFLAQSPPDEPGALRGLPCILHTHREAWNSWTLASDDDETTIDVQGPFATNQYTAARMMCLAGDGIARLPYYLVAADIEAGRLLRLFPKHQITTHSLFLVYLKNQYASRRLGAARELILSWFDDRPEIFV